MMEKNLTDTDLEILEFLGEGEAGEISEPFDGAAFSEFADKYER